MIAESSMKKKDWLFALLTAVALAMALPDALRAVAE